MNESAADRKRNLELFSSGRTTEWRNRLIWGDKKCVLPSLLPEFAGRVNLIYIDPPFDTGTDFSFMAHIPETDQTFTKEPSVIEQKAYRDTWGVSAEERARGVTSLDRYLGLCSRDRSFLTTIMDAAESYIGIIDRDTYQSRLETRARARTGREDTTL